MWTVLSREVSQTSRNEVNQKFDRFTDPLIGGFFFNACFLYGSDKSMGTRSSLKKLLEQSPHDEAYMAKDPHLSMYN